MCLSPEELIYNTIVSWRKLGDVILSTGILSVYAKAGQLRWLWTSDTARKKVDPLEVRSFVGTVSLGDAQLAQVNWLEAFISGKPTKPPSEACFLLSSIMRQHTLVLEPTTSAIQLVQREYEELLKLIQPTSNIKVRNWQDYV